MIQINKKEAQEFIEWADKQAFCNSGQHICDRLASIIERQLNDIKCDLCSYTGETSVFGGKNLCEQCCLGETNH